MTHNPVIAAQNRSETSAQPCMLMLKGQMLMLLLAIELAIFQLYCTQYANGESNKIVFDKKKTVTA